MRAVVQRVSRAAVRVDGAATGAVERGLLVLLGVAAGDGEGQARWMADKVAQLRIFEDPSGKMAQKATAFLGQLKEKGLIVE